MNNPDEPQIVGISLPTGTDVQSISQRVEAMEMLLERIGDLTSQSLLDLRPLGVTIDKSGDLGEPDHVAAAVRDVRDVRLPDKGDQVMLTQRVHRNVAHHDHLVMVGFEHGREVLRRLLMKTGANLRIHTSDPVGRVEQSVAIGILADRKQDLPDGGGDTFLIDFRGVYPSISGLVGLVTLRE